MNADPTPQDVERLASLWYTDANWRKSGQAFKNEAREKARHLLAAGVTLPPEPDTPAEAEERYWVGDGQSDNKVYERGRAHIYAETYLTLDASRIARLLNLDAKYEDGIEAEVERLRDKASARAVKATALALDDARAELARERDLERDLFAGARPAAPTVTAEDMMAALKGTLIDAHLTFEPSALGEWAANISRLLAEQGGEG